MKFRYIQLDINLYIVARVEIFVSSVIRLVLSFTNIIMTIESHNNDNEISRYFI